MKRKDFLKLVGTGGGALFFGGIAHPQMQLSYALEKIKIYDNYVKGTQFYRKNFMKTPISLGQTIALQRETDNVHDQFAIKVICQNKQLGYIPAYENIVLANLMDKGVPLTASVSEIIDKSKNEDDRGYLMNVVAVQIFAELMVPVSNIVLTDLTKDRAANSVDVYRQGENIIKKNEK